ncbi:sigma factor-like helix-turn-helix DNA-binding protein [Nocardia lasii]|uniref:Sigma factor-like helix-turn-helix DNA-binding protein n=1 Tax=Nocardia lasii TaxID=1616107 RepID=A0ABW1JQZ1_9NOCA
MYATDHPYTEWLGRHLAEVPPNEQSRVFEWVFGAQLAEITRYAERCARSSLAPHLRPHADDIASRVAEDLVLKPLPPEPVRSWRVYVEVNVRRWKVKELMRRESARKRDAGWRVDDDELLAGAGGDSATDSFALFDTVEFYAALLARMPDKYRTVFATIFVVTPDGYDRRTIMEVARMLSVPDGTIRRLSAEGMPLLREITRAELGAAA